MKKKIDLLNFVEQGGCSAKLSASELNKALAGLPKMKHKNLLVDIDTHDDAGVYKINDDYALVQTTDFFLQYVPTHMILGKLQLLMRLAIYMLWADRY